MSQGLPSPPEFQHANVNVNISHVMYILLRSTNESTLLNLLYEYCTVLYNTYPCNVVQFVPASPRIWIGEDDGFRLIGMGIVVQYYRARYGMVWYEITELKGEGESNCFFLVYLY